MLKRHSEFNDLNAYQTYSRHLDVNVCYTCRPIWWCDEKYCANVRM